MKTNQFIKKYNKWKLPTKLGIWLAIVGILLTIIFGILPLLLPILFNNKNNFQVLNETQLYDKRLLIQSSFIDFKKSFKSKIYTAKEEYIKNNLNNSDSFIVNARTFPPNFTVCFDEEECVGFAKQIRQIKYNTKYLFSNLLNKMLSDLSFYYLHQDPENLILHVNTSNNCKEFLANQITNQITKNILKGKDGLIYSVDSLGHTTIIKNQREIQKMFIEDFKTPIDQFKSIEYKIYNSQNSLINKQTYTFDDKNIKERDKSYKKTQGNKTYFKKKMLFDLNIITKLLCYLDKIENQFQIEIDKNYTTTKNMENKMPLDSIMRLDSLIYGEQIGIYANKEIIEELYKKGELALYLVELDTNNIINQGEMWPEFIYRLKMDTNKNYFIKCNKQYIYQFWATSIHDGGSYIDSLIFAKNITAKIKTNEIGLPEIILPDGTENYLACILMPRNSNLIDYHGIWYFN